MDSLGWGTPPRHVWLAESLFSGAQVQTALLTNSLTVHMAINDLSWVSSWHPALSEQNYRRQQGWQESQNHCWWHSGFQHPKLSGDWTRFQSAHHRANACRLRLANYFLREKSCATSPSLWGDSCPKLSAHEIGEPVLCLGLLGQKRALRSSLSSPWPCCVSCSWAASLLLHVPWWGPSHVLCTAFCDYCYPFVAHCAAFP